MSRPIDLTGRRFGRLTVIARAENSKDGRASWLCICDCGNKCIVVGDKLRRGEKKSCGCMMREWQHMSHSSHGLSDSKLYRIWRSMRGRCKNPGVLCYKDYGGRGIKVCDEWESSFIAFLAWAVQAGYQDGLTIDRIDVNGDYSPQNCRWATRLEQSRNKRNSRFLEFQGERKTLSEWAEITGIPLNLISGRYTRGWSAERIFCEPIHSDCRNHRRKSKPEPRG